MIKILIDMNLSPKWVNVFTAEGWEAVHWSEVGAVDARDRVILKWAKDKDFSAHDFNYQNGLNGNNVPNKHHAP
jgi:predicted nuclease of predicted toxin-antitoxin system